MKSEIQKAIIRGARRFILSQLEPVQKRLQELEQRAMTPGPQGLQGDKGDAGARGQDGRDGADGRDGTSPSPEAVAKVMEGDFAKWALAFERMAQATLQRAIDQMPPPKDGRDGRDGVGFDNWEIERDGRGGVHHFYKLGDQVVKEFQTREFIDRGVYRPEEEYLQLNGVTFGGSYWICQKDHPTEKPGDGDQWRLAVKKGRDGKR